MRFAPDLIWTAFAASLFALVLGIGCSVALATSFDWLLSLIAMPLGFAVSGPVADRIGIPPTLVGAAVLMAVPCLLITFVPGVRRVRRTDQGTIVLEPAG